MQNIIEIGEATYKIARQFDPRKDPSQLIIEQLLRKDLPPQKPHHRIDRPAAPQV